MRDLLDGIKDFLGEVLENAVMFLLVVLVFALIILLMIFPVMINLPWLMIVTVPLGVGVVITIANN